MTHPSAFSSLGDTDRVDTAKRDSGLLVLVLLATPESQQNSSYVYGQTHLNVPLPVSFRQSLSLDFSPSLKRTSEFMQKVSLNLPRVSRQDEMKSEGEFPSSVVSTL